MRDIARSPLANAHVKDGPTVPSPLFELRVPAFMEFSEKRNRRALIDYFCNVFSHLVVFSKDPGNPFRHLILPLAHKESPVMNAIYALSSAHLESSGVNTEEKSSYFHNKATRGLARLIDHQERSSTEDVLGAIMLLVYYEAVGEHLYMEHFRNTNQPTARPTRQLQYGHRPLKRRNDCNEELSSTIKSYKHVSPTS